MAAPTNSGESDMANEDIFSNLSPLRSPSCILPLRSTPSPPRHFLPSSSSMAVPYQGSTSGTSDEAIEEEFDVTIYFNIPSSPSHVPTSSLQRPFLPSSNSMVVYQPFNHSMENLPQNQLQDPYTFLQQLQQQHRRQLRLLKLLQRQLPLLLWVPQLQPQQLQPQQWIFLLPNKLKLSLLQLLPQLMQVLQMQELRLQSMLLGLQSLLPELQSLLPELQSLLPELESLLPELQHIFLLSKQMQKPRLKQWTLSLLNLQVNLHCLFSQSKQMDPQLEQILLSLNNPPNLSEATVDDEIGIGGVGTWDCEMEKVQTPGGERENKRTSGVRIAIPLEDIPQTKGVCLKDAAMNLNAQQEILDEDFGIGVEAVGMGSERTGDSETEDEFNLVSRSRQLNLDTLPSNQASAATIDTNSTVVKEIVPLLLLPTAQQENLDEDFGNGVEAVGMGSERTEESETEDEFNTVSPSTNGQLNSRNLGKRKREKMTPGGERRNKKTNGVRIAIPLEDILQTKKMLLKDAAKHLKVSKSTLKRVCRGYDIHRWPPRGEHKPISQSCPTNLPLLLIKSKSHN